MFLEFLIIPWLSHCWLSKWFLKNLPFETKKVAYEGDLPPWKQTKSFLLLMIKIVIQKILLWLKNILLPKDISLDLWFFITTPMKEAKWKGLVGLWQWGESTLWFSPQQVLSGFLPVKLCHVSPIQLNPIPKCQTLMFQSSLGMGN